MINQSESQYARNLMINLFCLFFYLFIYLFVYLFICSFVHLFICSFVHLFICSFVNLFICSFVHLFICSFVHLFICSFVHLLLTDKFVQCDNKSTYEKNNSQVTDKNKRQDKSTHEKSNSRVNNKNKRPDNYGVVNRKVTVIGDSMITGVRKKKNRLIDNDQPNTRIYVKDHLGATVDDIIFHHF